MRLSKRIVIVFGAFVTMTILLSGQTNKYLYASDNGNALVIEDNKTDPVFHTALSQSYGLDELSLIEPLLTDPQLGWECWDIGVPDPCFNTLNAIDLLSETYGWMVGEAGTIIQRQGTSLVKFDVATNLGLNGVNTLSESNAWIVGDKGVILHWDGVNWQQVESHTTYNLHTVAMLSEFEGWAGGDNGTMLYWDGFEWQSVDTPTNGSVRSMDMLSPYDGWAVGSDIWHWDGNAWVDVASPTSKFIYDVDMVSSTEGWAVGYTVILRWDGLAWSIFDTPGNIDLHTVSMASSSYGWIGGITSAIPPSVIYYRWDGTDWTARLPLRSGSPYDLDLVSTSYGLAVGSSGQVMRLIGSYWDIYSGLRFKLLAIDNVSENAIWAAGYNLPVQSGTVQHWNGVDWATDYSGGQELRGIDMLSENDGWAVGDAGTILRYDGMGWTNVSSPVSSRLNDIFILSTNDGWIVGQAGSILHWNGTQWSQVSSPVSEDLNAIFMNSPTDGWAVGELGIILHWDGLAWVQSYSPVTVDLNDVIMASPNNGWAVGGSILRWNGVTWTMFDVSGYYNGADFSPEGSVWAMGFYSSFLFVDGDNWLFTSTPTTQGSYDAVFVGNRDGWAVGGSILRYRGYSISGYVKDSRNIRIEGALVELNTGQTAVTDHNGFYSFNNLEPGIYEVVISKTDYSFSPFAATVIMPPEVIVQDFTGVNDGGPPTPFLALPISYNGPPQNALSNHHIPGGMLTSWFDHEEPTYNENQELLLHTGRLLNSDNNPHNNGDVLCFGPLTQDFCYDGHDGYDFSNQSGLDILAAAEGTVSKTTFSPSGFGNYIVLYHDAGYFTLYGHLENIFVTQGVSVAQEQIIGKMGNTGNSDGTHLHFGVYRDDGDGIWEPGEGDIQVDPSRWYGREVDPWVQAGNPVSHWLWQFSRHTKETINGVSGGTITDPSGHLTLTIPLDAFSGDMTLEVSQVSPSGPTIFPWTAVTGAYETAVESWEMNTSPISLGGAAAPRLIPFFSNPITVSLQYSDTISHIDYGSLTIHRWDSGLNSWLPLSTTTDVEIGTAIAQTDELGSFQLQGALLCEGDIYEPDDSFYSALPLRVGGTPVIRLLDIDTDSDWFLFEASSEINYKIETVNQSVGTSSLIEIFDQDGITLLEQSMENENGTASVIEWTAPANGIYFVRVLSNIDGATGCSSLYSIGIQDDRVEIYLPLIKK